MKLLRQLERLSMSMRMGRLRYRAASLLRETSILRQISGLRRE